MFKCICNLSKHVKNNIIDYSHFPSLEILYELNFLMTYFFNNLNHKSFNCRGGIYIIKKKYMSKQRRNSK